MATYSFAAPIVPGKTEAWKEFAKEMGGPRRKEWAASRARAGVTGETAWLQTTPHGDFAVVTMEGPDIEKSLVSAGTSTDPFDQWFSQKIKELHGLTTEEMSKLPPNKILAKL
jgi:hypothetical protein